jgi:hypothetical protein
MPESETPSVMFYHLPLMRTPEIWQALYDRVMSDGHNFVVIDNLAQTLNGSVNDDAVVRQFFDGVRLFVRAAIPVVVVAHSSDKAGMNGYKPETPMGSAYISQAVRWRIFARRSRKGNMTLRFMGNHAEPSEMTLYHGAGARFDVLDVKSPEALKASAEGRQRTNGLFDRVANDRELCRIDSARGVGRALYKQFPNQWASDEAAYKAFNRSKATAGGEYIDGRWKVPA